MKLTDRADAPRFSITPILSKVMRTTEHALLIRLPLSDDDLGTTADDDRAHALEEAIESKLISRPDIGEFDGHEFGAGWCVLFCYGPDAERLFDAISDVLLATDLPRGSIAVKRYGPPGAREELLQLTVRPT